MCEYPLFVGADLCVRPRFKHQAPKGQTRRSAPTTHDEQQRLHLPTNSRNLHTGRAYGYEADPAAGQMLFEKSEIEGLSRAGRVIGQGG